MKFNNYSSTEISVTELTNYYVIHYSEYSENYYYLRIPSSIFYVYFRPLLMCSPTARMTR